MKQRSDGQRRVYRERSGNVPRTVGQGGPGFLRGAWLVDKESGFDCGIKERGCLLQDLVFRG